MGSWLTFGRAPAPPALASLCRPAYGVCTCLHVFRYSHTVKRAIPPTAYLHLHTRTHHIDIYMALPHTPTHYLCFNTQHPQCA
eukprot:scaffold35228_cov124-Isochrysis_galbana.AAC.2